MYLSELELAVSCWYTSCDTGIVADTHSMLHCPVVKVQLELVPESDVSSVSVDRNWISRK